ncbi:MAG: hypothetical protein FWC70_10215 [Defluviitaleaceae bacterium]|nr:hypothetical protein [Defluviitaleaceae bacterium]
MRGSVNILITMKPPKPDILILRCKKPLLSRLFSVHFVPPPGYFLIIADDLKYMRHSPDGGEVERKESVFLLKINFEISWAAWNLPCIRDEDVVPGKLGFNGIACFEVNPHKVNAPEVFFRKIEPGKSRKIFVEQFKRIWSLHWDGLLKDAFFKEEINYRQITQVVESLKTVIDKKMQDIYGVTVTHISIKSTT